MSEGSSGRERSDASGSGPPLDKLIREANRNAGAFWGGLIVGVLVVIAVVLLVLQNAQATSVTWLMLHFTAPLWLLLLVSVIAGIVIERLAVWLWRLRRTRAARRRAAQAQLNEFTRGKAGPPHGAAANG